MNETDKEQYQFKLKRRWLVNLDTVRENKLLKMVFS